MNEVEKMYEKAEPNRNCNLYKHFTECPMKHTQCEDCENFIYPPFTAEKQLELIKWLGKIAGKLEISRDYNDTQYLLYFYINRKSGARILPNIVLQSPFYLTGRSEDFEESLAGLINSLWQDLTEEECKQIRNILE